MIVLIFSVILLSLAILERIIYLKKNKSWKKTRLFIGILIVILMFSLSYFVTDTAIDVFYVFMSMNIFIFIGLVNFRSNVEWIKSVLFILGLPLMVYFHIKMFENILIYPQNIFLLLLTLNMILSYPYKYKGTKKENIAFVVGIAMAALLMFSYYKTFDFEYVIIRKQELVAQQYLKKELDMNGLNIYLRDFRGSLRGEEAAVIANDPSSGTVILMKYRNNKIVSYDIRD